MASNINVSGINENFPIAGVNQSSQGFRDNTRMLKNNLAVAAVELSNLQTKTISIIGDATGTSGQLGLNSANPSAINLQLAASGVTAGTYTSAGNDITLTVDSKGRVTQVSTTVKPTRPSVVGTFGSTATTTPTLNNLVTLTTPSFTFDEYGTLVSTGTNTFNAGIKDYPMAKGSILAGNASGVSSEFPLPTNTFSPADTWVLTWNPLFGTTHSLRWFRLPPVVENLAEVIQIQQGAGINVDNTDNEYPEVSLDINNLDVYPLQDVQSNTLALVYDPTSATHYKIDYTKLVTSVQSGTIYLTKVSEDPAPVLGGDLDVNGKKIIGGNTGIVLQTSNNGKITFNGQSMPPAPGPTNAFLRTGAGGNMYWETIDFSQYSGVTSVTPGIGIDTSPISGITSTGSVNLNVLKLPSRTPIVDQDFIPLQNFTSYGRATVRDITFTMPDVAFVDSNYGIDEPTAGTSNRPYRTITYAISRLPTDDNSIKRLLLLPGTYAENISINRKNLKMTSLLTAEHTIVRGTMTLSNVDNVSIDDITFDMYSALDNPNVYNIAGAGGIGNVDISNCKFVRYYDEFDRCLPIALLQGEATGRIIFNSCTFMGTIVNNMTEGVDPLNPDDVGSFGVMVNNPITNDDERLSIDCGPGSKTIVNNATHIESFNHRGGYLEVSNIEQVIGIYTDDDYDSVPDGDDPEDYDIHKKGLISTANASNTNALFLTNVSFNFKGDLGYGNVIVNKTGTASYEFVNVKRYVDFDTVNGDRFGFIESYLTDTSIQYKSLSVSGNQTLSTSCSAYNLTLTGNASIALPIVNTIYPRNIIVPIKIVVTQDATGGRTLDFTSNGTIVWDNAGSMPAVATAANSITVYEFENIGSVWLAKRTFVQT